jgi:hypothetical protein
MLNNLLMLKTITIIKKHINIIKKTAIKLYTNFLQPFCMLKNNKIII